MSQEVDGQKVDTRKRKFLIAATSAVGGVAVAGVAVPLVMSMMPSARAKAAGAPVEVDISKIEPGMLLTVEWRGKPVWIVNRTKEMLDQLPKNDPHAGRSQQSTCPSNPRTARMQPARSSRNIWWQSASAPTSVARPPTAGMSAQRIWAQTGRAASSAPATVRSFDLAARVFKGVPAPTNLVIPPHQYLSDAKLLIGVDAKAPGLSKSKELKECLPCKK